LVQIRSWVRIAFSWQDGAKVILRSAGGLNSGEPPMSGASNLFDPAIALW